MEIKFKQEIFDSLENKINFFALPTFNCEKISLSSLEVESQFLKSFDFG